MGEERQIGRRFAGQDYPDHRAYGTYEQFNYRMVTAADGFEEAPCPYGPH